MKYLFILISVTFIAIKAQAQSIETSQDLIELDFGDVLNYNDVSFTNTGFAAKL